ncbi:E3 ubiquitin ligase Rnf157-like [Amblyraja radiata]|uniref:E3 ubiquitin ligase Rnf157-like n=1 Tax=Amblyraja radiata TaxID=386614 RepID=UPI001403AC04|nr:E3 ubiquitin ligase Rnf157-like [Amblyraja radiata]
MSMASSQFSMDTMSSLSGSSLPQGPASPEEGLTEASAEEEGNERETPPVQEMPAVGTEHRDSEGNAVAEERAGVAEHESGDHGWWDRTADFPVSDNNNQLEGLDNDPCTEVTAPGTAGGEDGRGLWTPTPGGTEPREDSPSQYTPLTL